MMTASNTNVGYFGDVRDRFDELYSTSASFVLIGFVPEENQAHLEFAGNLDEEVDIESFKMVCYSYEDTFDWNKLPLTYVQSTVHSFRWKTGDQIVYEEPLENVKDVFCQRTEEFLNQFGGYENYRRARCENVKLKRKDVTGTPPFLRPSRKDWRIFATFDPAWEVKDLKAISLEPTVNSLVNIWTKGLESDTEYGFLGPTCPESIDGILYVGNDFAYIWASESLVDVYSNSESRIKLQLFRKTYLNP